VSILYSSTSTRGTIEVFDLPCHIGIAFQEPKSARLYRAWPKTDPEAQKILKAIGKENAVVPSAE
jgi:hypothetical protein